MGPPVRPRAENSRWQSLVSHSEGGERSSEPVDSQGSVQGLARGRNGVVQGVDLPLSPDPEVRPRARRRRFTAAYKQRIVAEAERCAPGELGALLRGEGLYSSHLTKWRRQVTTGDLGTRGKRAGTGADMKTTLQQLARAERENRRLRLRLERAETIIEVQKKISALLQMPSLKVEH